MTLGLELQAMRDREVAHENVRAFAFIAVLHKRAQWGWSRLCATGLSCAVTDAPVDHEGDGFRISAIPVMAIPCFGHEPIVFVLSPEELESLGPCPNL